MSTNFETTSSNRFLFWNKSDRKCSFSVRDGRHIYRYCVTIYWDIDVKSRTEPAEKTPMLRCDFNIQLQCNSVEITHQYSCSLPAKFVAFFRTPFCKNTSWRLLLQTNNLTTEPWLQKQEGSLWSQITVVCACVFFQSSC